MVGEEPSHHLQVWDLQSENLVIPKLSHQFHLLHHNVQTSPLWAATVRPEQNQLIIVAVCQAVIWGMQSTTILLPKAWIKTAELEPFDYQQNSVENSQQLLQIIINYPKAFFSKESQLYIT